MLRIVIVCLLVVAAFPVSAQQTYLGNLSNNTMDPNGVSNGMGKYGNPFSPYSINNRMGTYGNPFSPSSVHNPFATTPPRVYAAPNGQWQLWGRPQ